MISGNGGSLVKVGTGMLTLSGADTYGGGTIVNAGILRLGTGGSLAATGRLTVNGGSFDLNGHEPDRRRPLRLRRDDHTRHRHADGAPEHHHQLPRRHLRHAAG